MSTAAMIIICFSCSFSFVLVQPGYTSVFLQLLIIITIGLYTKQFQIYVDFLSNQLDNMIKQDQELLKHLWQSKFQSIQQQPGIEKVSLLRILRSMMQSQDQMFNMMSGIMQYMLGELHLDLTYLSHQIVTGIFASKLFNKNKLDLIPGKNIQMRQRSGPHHHLMMQ